ncbi:hypothetical protein RclHR1_06180004 [Rhizophagus clarus]|uniref:Uncharacterized protein n=1 Tax=Rhizophagus clarus TaxID=94130 RepID=A0A2Z6SI19_9GLOM|nr:hypothetical protein RclHR1_06180004 [Rhizophagus clarus]
MLWQVWMDKKEYLNLNSDVKNISIKRELKGIIGNYWTKQPLKEFIHVIVYSPDLTILRKMDSIMNSLNPANISLQQLYKEQNIKHGSILFYNRTYKNVEFTRKCKIKDIYDIKKLSVILTSTDNEEILMSFIVYLSSNCIFSNQMIALKTTHGLPEMPMIGFHHR